MTMDKHDPDERITFAVRRSHVYGVVGLVVGFVGGMAVATVDRNDISNRRVGSEASMANATQPSPSADTSFVVNWEGRPFKGPQNAPVTVVEFTDYQCPFCKHHANTVLDELLEVHGDRIRYVVRNFPIPSLHPDAVTAARAAECAFEQDSFWEYHDRLFEYQALDVPGLKQHAVELALDTAAFNYCLESGSKFDVVMRDVAEGSESNVTGTPTFFVNGQKLEGVQSMDTFESAIGAALAATDLAATKPTSETLRRP